MSKADKRFWRMFWFGLFILALLAVGVCFNWEVPNPWTLATLVYMAGIVIGGESETLRAAASAMERLTPVPSRPLVMQCTNCLARTNCLTSGPAGRGLCRSCYAIGEAVKAAENPIP